MNSTSSRLDQMVKTLETNGTYRFVMDNIVKSIAQELEPQRDDIENGIIDIGVAVEDLRQKIMLYLNDLCMKNVILDIPGFKLSYVRESSEIFFEIHPESFCSACGVSQNKLPIYHVEVSAVH